MSFTEAFDPNASSAIVRNVFVGDVLGPPFQAALDKALEQLWKHGHIPTSTQKVLVEGLRVFISSVSRIAAGRAKQLFDEDHEIAQLIRQHGLFEELPVDDISDSFSSFKKIDLSKGFTDPFSQVDDLSDVTAFPSDTPLSSEPSEKKDQSFKPAPKIKDGDDFSIVASVMAVYAQVFREVTTIFDNNKVDILPLLFLDNRDESNFGEEHFHVFLAYLNVFYCEILDQNDRSRFGHIDSSVLLMYDIVATLVRLMAVERYVSSQQGAKAKALFRLFYKTDFSATLEAVIATTTPLNWQGYLAEDLLKCSHNDNTLLIPQIEYKTLLRLYALFSIFSSCPATIHTQQKDLYILDMSGGNEQSSNPYKDCVNRLDFSQIITVNTLRSRFIPILSALFTVLYQYQPDLLLASMNHSSFFGWITGHSFAPDLYVSIDTVAEYTDMEERLKITKFPFFDTSDSRLERGTPKEVQKVICKKIYELPSFLILSLTMYDLMRNKSFLEYLTAPESSSKIPLLDLWLSVSSYISQHQKGSHFGRYGVKAFLFALLKLTSKNSLALANLKTRQINENVWKLCHQKAPFVSLSANGPKVSALLYCVDVLQVTLRFNIAKNFNLDNAKLALTAMYQILKECEVRPFEDLINHQWNEVYNTLVHFLLFVGKNRNNEDVKYVVEEVFAIFELILSPSFAKIIEKSPDYYIVGSHDIKSMNYDLYYILLHEYRPILSLFEKFIIDESNFKRTRSAFDRLAKEFNLNNSKEIDESVVVPTLNRLSLLSDDVAEDTNLDLSKFNYAETFKFLKESDTGCFEEEAEFIDLLIHLFSKR
ncbi:hypothetical protein PUMCH_000127 [Australozyma saopauloensis]|uniref:Armadillo-like helical domain-containing protein n=1 Tax=Australozyma saopauloensis TaxID=291208 RepID=A0AAX4H4P4_9ASCO|nr:hypothetical protein PUMCH_000127 [[Candida] saopauloensis]